MKFPKSKKFMMIVASSFQLLCLAILCKNIFCITCPNDTEINPFYFPEFCLKVMTDKLENQQMAEEICKQNGGHLISIHSNDANVYYTRLFSKLGADYWSGFTGNVWTDKTMDDFRNIDPSNK